LGNIGKAYQLLDIASPLAKVDKVRLDDFVFQAIGAVPGSPGFEVAWVLAPNPVFSVAGDIALSDALSGIPQVIYAAETDDETAQFSSWVVPLAHPLEVWGDVRAADGTYGVGQPQIGRRDRWRSRACSRTTKQRSRTSACQKLFSRSKSIKPP
ncbi:MAG: hypothetical protein ACK57P_15065, partial [Planctomycetota bacterium]